MDAPKIKLKRRMTAYEVLSVDPDSKKRHKEIARNYRALVKKHHPDKGGVASVFRVINESYELIGDTAARIIYDRNYRPTLDLSDVINETQKGRGKETESKRKKVEVAGLLGFDETKKTIDKL